MKELKEKFLTTIGKDDFLSILHEKHGDRFKKYREDWKKTEKLECTDYQSSEEQTQ